MVPTKPKMIKSFLATVGFYRTFIPHFADKAVPLTNLLKNSNKWKWTEVEQFAFEQLRDALCEDPVLKHPDFEKPFELHTDASYKALGSVLMQEHNGVLHPISYYSRKLRDAETRYPVTEIEALSIITGIKNFSYYLYGHDFTVVTDHSALTDMFTKQTNNNRVNRWASFLLDYNFQVKYKKGSTHHLPDALSRYVSAVDFKKILIGNIDKTKLQRYFLSGKYSENAKRRA